MGIDRQTACASTVAASAVDRVELFDIVQKTFKKRLNRRRVVTLRRVGYVSRTPWDQESESEAEDEDEYEDEGEYEDEDEGEDEAEEGEEQQGGCPHHHHDEAEGEDEGEDEGEGEGEDEYEDEDEDNRIPEDSVLVVWLNEKTGCPEPEVLEKIEDLTIIDRASLLTSNIVRRLQRASSSTDSSTSPSTSTSTSTSPSPSTSPSSSPSPSTSTSTNSTDRRGTIVRVDNVVTVRRMDNLQVERVDGRELRSLLLSDGEVVVMDKVMTRQSDDGQSELVRVRLLGLVLNQLVKVRVRYNDGSEATIDYDMNVDDLEWASKHAPDAPTQDFDLASWVVGDLVRFVGPGPYDGVEWHDGASYQTAQHADKFARVLSIEPRETFVRWIGASDVNDLLLQRVEERVATSDLRSLESVYDHEQIRLGWAYLWRPQPDEPPVSVRIVNINTTVSVLWQDGELEPGIPSIAVELVPNADDQFAPLPGNFIAVEDPVGLAPSYDAIVCRVDLSAGVADVRRLDMAAATALYGDLHTVSLVACRSPDFELPVLSGLVFRDLDPRGAQPWAGVVVAIDHDRQRYTVRWMDGTVTDEQLSAAFGFISDVDSVDHAVPLGSVADWRLFFETLRLSMQPAPVSQSTAAAASSSRDDAVVLVEPVTMLDSPVYADHKFLSAAAPSSPMLKQLRREWQLLKDLPDHIRVVSWTSRIDLLSAMIVGPPDSLYEDLVFLFDIQIPAAYPSEPPLVFYRSDVADRMHPHLYPEGKVCLSLLGTWEAESSCERWTPGTSSVMQVLLSIQGLVLSTTQPFFSEPGYENFKDTPRGQALSLAYNERALALSFQAAIRQLKTAPPVFRPSLVQHYTTDAVAARLLARMRRLTDDASFAHGTRLIFQRQLECFSAVIAEMRAVPQQASSVEEHCVQPATSADSSPKKE